MNFFLYLYNRRRREAVEDDSRLNEVEAIFYEAVQLDSDNCLKKLVCVANAPGDSDAFEKVIFFLYD